LTTGLGPAWTLPLSPPWRADKIPGGYVVRDADGQALVWIFSRDSEAEAMQAKVLTKTKLAGLPSNVGARLPQSTREGGLGRAKPPACTLFGGVAFQQHSVDRHYGTQRWPTRDTGLGQLREASMRLPTLSLLLISAVLFGEMHAASAQSPNSYPWCSRGGDGDINYNICYFTSKEQCQGTTLGVGAFCFANQYYSPPVSDEAVNAPRPRGGERYQLPGEPSRQVDARAVRAKQSAATRERSPAGRPDAGAAEAQVPKQEMPSFPFADVIAAGVARVVSAVDGR
jgi:Protein of unknown function (DUF3551)